jgi:hypothetical protein
MRYRELYEIDGDHDQTRDPEQSHSRMRTKRRIIQLLIRTKSEKVASSSPAPHVINQGGQGGAKGETREGITLVEANQPLTP